MNETITLNVTGMKCGGCENNVISKLSVMAGISQVTASSKSNEVSVEFDNSVVTLAAISAAITDAGYTVSAA